jgi:branched-chain amino acid transport system substrate-binding protein
MEIAGRNLPAVRGTFAALPRAVALASGQELTLSVIGVLSGPAEQWELALRGAAEFVAAKANRDRLVKVDGAACDVVNLVGADRKSKAEGAAAAANTLAGRESIIGAISSPELTGVKPIAKRQAPSAKRNSMLVMGHG